MPSIRLRRQLAGALVLVVAAAGLAACSNTEGGDGPAATAASGPPSPGIDAQTVKIGYVIVDSGTLSERLGFRR